MIAPDVALDEFARFCAAMDLDIDEKEMNEEELKEFTATRRKVLLAIERGNLVINEQGEPVFTPKLGNVEPITFQEPTGATILAIDKAKKGQDAQKAFLMLADFTGQPVVRYAKMAGRDFKICQALMTLFLG
jgi:hypothetical protein